MQMPTRRWLALAATDAAVAVVAAVVDLDADARQGRALGHVLGLVGVVVAEVQQHRDAEDRAALNAGLAAGNVLLPPRVMTSSTGRSRPTLPS